MRGFLAEIEPVLERADVMAFSHFGTIRALVAQLLDLTDEAMMKLPVENGEAFLFTCSIGADGRRRYARQELPPLVLPRAVAEITPPPDAPPRAV